MKDFLREEENMELYAKAFGYIVDEICDYYEVRPDGGAVRRCEIKGLRGTVGQIYHCTTTSRGDVTDFTLEADAKKPMRWELDRERSNPLHKEGHVVLEGGLKEGETSVSYCLACELSPGSVCLTKEEIAKEYGADPLPYETVERQIIFPTRKLLLQVRFFDGYKASAQPAVFHGKERLLDPIRPKSDSFEFDEKSNSASFCVSCPRLFHSYIIYWEPVD